MNERLKRALIITGFVLVVIGMFVVIYFVFFRSTDQLNGNTNQPGNINGLPNANNGNRNASTGSNVNSLPVTNTSASGPSKYADGGATLVETVVNTPVAGQTVSNTGSLQYYDRQTGKFFQVSADGMSTKVMTDAIYKDLDTVTWDPSGTKAILQFPDGSKVLYNFATKKQSTLPRELDNFSFSPTGSQIVSKYLDAKHLDNQWLMVSNPDGTGSQSVEQLAENADKVIAAWSPNNAVVGTYERSSTSSSSDIIFLGKNNENYPLVTVDGKGFTPNWSPDGSKILYSVYSDDTNNAAHLYIMNGDVNTLGQNIIDLNLNTSANKCAFSQDNYTIYCAVPYYTVENSGPIPSLGYSVPDNLYAIDMLRGTTTLLARPVDEHSLQQYSVGSIRLSGDESAIYFTDANTGKLHRILLP